MTMGDFVIGQIGRSHRVKKDAYAVRQLTNGKRNHIISAPKPRWQSKPIQLNSPAARSVGLEENKASSVAYFKSAPIVPAKSCTARPIMGACCETCTPASKNSLVDERTEYQGLWNILVVPERNPDRSLWSRAFCHALHVYRIKAHSEFTVVTPDKILSNPNVASALTSTVDSLQASSASTGSSILERQQRRVRKLVVLLRTTMSTVVLRLTSWMLYKTLPCLLNSVQIHKGKLEYIKRASSSPHPLVFIPLHLSHLDYFLLTFILYDAGIRVPYIAAGDNLRFTIVGWFLRCVGAFFIRRKYDEDDEQRDVLYRAVLQAYMNELFKNNENLGFFIEGGRSRSGKPQMPKGGLLKIIIEAHNKGLLDDVLLVPVGIGYEKIIDRGYVDELMGKPKVMETTWGAFKAVVRALCGNYGNIRVDFAQPFSLKEYAASVLRSSPDESLVTHLGRHLVYDATWCTAVMSTQLTAFLLLNKYRGGCSPEELLSSFVWLRMECVARGVDVGFSGDDQHVLSHALKLLSHTFKKEKDGTITPKPNMHLSLQYYSNSVLRVFVVNAVLATCLLVSSDITSDNASVRCDTVCDMCEKLCDLLQEEFIFTRPCQHFNSTVVAAIDRLVTEEVLHSREPGVMGRGKMMALEIDDDYDMQESAVSYLTINPNKDKQEELNLFSSALSPLITSYFYTVAKLSALVDNQMEEKQFVKLVQSEIQQRCVPYRECISVEPIQNALKVLKGKGVIESLKQDSINLLYLTEQYDDCSKVAEILGHVAQFIV